MFGKCDLVELWLSGKNVVRVSHVEFKRGRKKVSDVDRVQVCAQVLCLEEMFGLTIESGQLYYLQEKRRSDVVIDKVLREKTLSLAVRARELWDSGITPAAVYSKRTCDNCSLVDICMPKSVGSGGKTVDRFIQNQIRLMRENCDKEVE